MKRKRKDTSSINITPKLVRAAVKYHFEPASTCHCDNCPLRRKAQELYQGGCIDLIDFSHYEEFSPLMLLDASLPGRAEVVDIEEEPFKAFVDAIIEDKCDPMATLIDEVEALDEEV